MGGRVYPKGNARSSSSTQTTSANILVQTKTRKTELGVGFSYDPPSLIVKDEAQCDDLWAEDAFQIRHSQADLDVVKAAGCSGGGEIYAMMKNEIGAEDGELECTEWAEEALELRGSSADRDRVMKVQCSQRKSEYDKIIESMSASLA